MLRLHPDLTDSTPLLVRCLPGLQCIANNKAGCASKADCCSTGYKCSGGRCM